jgi:hypothetical protein
MDAASFWLDDDHPFENAAWLPNQLRSRGDVVAKPRLKKQPIRDTGSSTDPTPPANLQNRQSTQLMLNRLIPAPTCSHRSPM